MNLSDFEENHIDPLFEGFTADDAEEHTTHIFFEPIVHNGETIAVAEFTFCDKCGIENAQLTQLYTAGLNDAIEEYAFMLGLRGSDDFDDGEELSVVRYRH